MASMRAVTSVFAWVEMLVAWLACKSAGMRAAPSDCRWADSMVAVLVEMMAG